MKRRQSHFNISASSIFYTSSYGFSEHSCTNSPIHRMHELHTHTPQHVHTYTHTHTPTGCLVGWPSSSTSKSISQGHSVRSNINSSVVDFKNMPQLVTPLRSSFTLRSWCSMILAAVEVDRTMIHSKSFLLKKTGSTYRKWVWYRVK